MAKNQINTNDIVMVSVPVEEPVPQPRALKSKSVIPQYRLHLHKPNGQLRVEIPKAIFTEMSGRWGDIIRCISENRFQTVDQICEAVWAMERRTFNRGHDRTRAKIEECIIQLHESGLLMAQTP